MTVKPVTFTFTTLEPLNRMELARDQAAEQLGLDPADIACTAMTVETIHPIWSEHVSAVLSEPDPVTGEVTIIKEGEPAKEISPASYVVTSTWEPKVVQQEPVKWPSVTLPRGARWHGPVTIDGVTTEENFISDGDKLLLIDSDEGKAILEALK